MEMTEPFALTPGRPEQVTPDVRRILAPNPSPFTGPGTNTYLVGQNSLAVIDPGPDLDGHLQAILDAVLPGQTITKILVTHAHLDHSPLARRLSQVSGAPVLAYGDALAGRSRIMQDLANSAALGGGEGTDSGFRPDIWLEDEAWIEGEGWQIQALWTPGHFGNHLCFDHDGVVFTGDLVMAWSSSLVSPPDGDLTDFMRSCRRLRTRPAHLFLPGHGPAVEDPAARLDWLITHRLSREQALIEALSEVPKTPRALAESIYTDIAEDLMPAATRNVLAHLIDLTNRQLATPVGELSPTAEFKRPAR